MSEIVCGCFVLKQMEIEDLIQLSFVISQKAIDKKIGICLGENAQSSNDYHGGLPFRLSDDPLDNNCEYLFSGDGVSIMCCGYSEQRSETLSTRLLKIQELFRELFTTSKVMKIILDINFEEKIDTESMTIHVDDLAEKLLNLYQQNNNAAPVIRMCIADSISV